LPTVPLLLVPEPPVMYCVSTNSQRDPHCSFGLLRALPPRSAGWDGSQSPTWCTLRIPVCVCAQPRVIPSPLLPRPLPAAFSCLAFLPLPGVPEGCSNLLIFGRCCHTGQRHRGAEDWTQLPSSGGGCGVNGPEVAGCHPHPKSISCPMSPAQPHQRAQLGGMGETHLCCFPIDFSPGWASLRLRRNELRKSSEAALLWGGCAYPPHGVGVTPSARRWGVPIPALPVLSCCGSLGLLWSICCSIPSFWAARSSFGG